MPRRVEVRPFLADDLGHWSTQFAKNLSPTGSSVQSINSVIPVHTRTHGTLLLLLPHSGGQGPFTWQHFPLWDLGTPCWVPLWQRGPGYPCYKIQQGDWHEVGCRALLIITYQHLRPTTSLWSSFSSRPRGTFLRVGDCLTGYSNSIL